MSAALASYTMCPCAARTSRRPLQASMSNFAGLKRHSALRSLQMEGTRIVASPSLKAAVLRQKTIQTSAAMEIFQLADELSYISGVAAVTFAVTLVGLAAGFVLLRVEALTEEGKL